MKLQEPHDVVPIKNHKLLLKIGEMHPFPSVLKNDLFCAETC